MKRSLLKICTIVLLFCIALSACGNQQPGNSSPSYPYDLLPRNEYDTELFYAENGFIRYEDALAGIDVSSHQGEIDWEKVKKAGVDFAIIRAAYRGYTHGGLNMDPYFLQNLQGAKAADLLTGVYFFSQATSVWEAREEAEFLLECLDDAELELPVYYDWETIEAEARTDKVTGEEVTLFALEFCETVAASGYEAGVYFNESMGYGFLQLPQLQRYEFWLAQYLDIPDFYYDFTTWQYSASGEVPGIDVPVDLNLRFLKEKQ